MEEVQSVVLETAELESWKESDAYGSLRIIRQSTFRWEMSNLKFLFSKLFKTQKLSIDILVEKSSR